VSIDLPDASEESGTDRDGVLSYAAEWHALAIGFLVGLTGAAAVVIAFAGYALGIGRSVFRETGHLRDAAREPAYSAGGIVLGLAVNTLLVGGSLLPFLPL
jgi:hypothetical protein